MAQLDLKTINVAKKLQYLPTQIGFMKKLFILLAGVVFFTACSNSSDQGGVVDDGIGTNDSDGALIDSTPGKPWDPAIDTTNMEDRVDIQQRKKVDTASLNADTSRPAHEPVLH
jgi:hypothetical protein